MNYLQDRIDGFYKYIKINNIKNREIVSITGFTKGAVSNIVTKKVDPSENFLNTFESKVDVKLSEFNKNNAIVASEVISETVQIPYYDADFSGGWGSAEIIKNMKPSFFITSPDFKKAEFACNLVGHSISRRIPSGAVIGMREIFEWQTYFPTNEIYGVVLKNDLRTVKIIKRSSADKNILILMPDPLDQHNQTEYEPEEVPIDFVVRFYQIVAWAQFEKIAM